MWSFDVIFLSDYADTDGVAINFCTANSTETLTTLVAH